MPDGHVRIIALSGLGGSRLNFENVDLGFGFGIGFGIGFGFGFGV